jgi:hypothetical protein
MSRITKEKSGKGRIGHGGVVVVSGSRCGKSTPEPMTHSRLGRVSCLVSDGKELDTIGCLQSRILVNGRKVEPATSPTEEGILL